MPTLSSVASLRSSSAAAGLEAEEEKHRKEQQNQDTKSEELGESETGGDGPPSLLERLKLIPTAGKPSDAPLRAPAVTAAASAAAGSSQASGSRSASERTRRNSVDDNASQLCVENLGGSQQDLSLLGKTYIWIQPLILDALA